MRLTRTRALDLIGRPGRHRRVAVLGRWLERHHVGLDMVVTVSGTATTDSTSIDELTT